LEKREIIVKNTSKLLVYYNISKSLIKSYTVRKTRQKYRKNFKFLRNPKFFDIRNINALEFIPKC